MSRQICLVVFIIVMNLVSSTIVYQSVIYFQEVAYMYGPKSYPPDTDPAASRSPEDDWAKPGYLDP